MAQTVFTVPQGYTKITITGAPVGGTTLTAISATLLQDVDFSGSLTIGAEPFDPDPDSDPLTMEGSQDVSVPGVTWIANQFADSDAPHLAYIVNSAGGEEAYLITANDASGGLTIQTNFDLLADSDSSGATVPRHPASTTIKIRKANTLSTIFASGEGNLNFSDTIYVWTGSDWSSFNFSPLGFWGTSGAPGTDINNNVDNTVIFPDEGMFVLRTQPSDIVLTLFGEIPTKQQTATIPGSGFMASRYPVATTLKDLGIDAADWTFDDVVYIWNQSSGNWDSYVYSPLNKWSPAGNISGNSDDLPIPANSAVFVVRSSGISAETGAVNATLPYDPFAE